MAPNAEEELLVVKPWGPQPEKVCQCASALDRASGLTRARLEANRLKLGQSCDAYSVGVSTGYF